MRAPDAVRRDRSHHDPPEGGEEPCKERIALSCVSLSRVRPANRHELCVIDSLILIRHANIDADRFDMSVGRGYVRRDSRSSRLRVWPYLVAAENSSFQASSALGPGGSCARVFAMVSCEAVAGKPPVAPGPHDAKENGHTHRHVRSTVRLASRERRSYRVRGMRPKQIYEHLRTRPFVPIRIHISDGSHYDVAHPELALVTQLQIAIAIEPMKDDVPLRFVFCDPLHVTRIEPFNGKRRTRPRPKRK